MALPTCETGVGNGYGQTNVPQGEVVTQFLPLQGPNESHTTFRGGVEFRDAITTGAGFNLALWLVSGPGPVYTDEVLITALSGVLTGPQQLVRSISATALMPVSGRPFNRTTDGFMVRANAQLGGSTTAPLGWGAEICNVDGAVSDCCAELNAKLDQVLAAVRQVYRNAP